MMVKNPSIYEINVRVWIKRFGESLDDVPDSYWEDLAKKGVNLVWLMGVWKTVPSCVEKYCFEDGLVKEYREALKDWRKEDVIGSPYAIDSYRINPELGSEKSLKRLKKRLNSLGILLILDFIGNHFHAESSQLKNHPEIFLRTNMNYLKDDPHTFFQSRFNESLVFAHGRDPFYPAWLDTVQVNLFSAEAREYFLALVLELTSVCDGLRCDMAMLSLNNVFKNTWGGVLGNMGYSKPNEEFWNIVIQEVKVRKKDFLFIAETYWDLEYDLQQMGFDYTYDKRLLEKFDIGAVGDIREHLSAGLQYQQKSVRFIENHDELRSLTAFGKDKARAAAVIMSTVPGMHFYFDGQLEGKRVKLPVQLGREPKEAGLPCIKEFYGRLLPAVSEPVFKEGSWEQLRPLPSWNGQDSGYEDILLWHLEFQGTERLVAVNFSDKPKKCRVKLSLKGRPDNIKFCDLLNNESYIRNRAEIECDGLYIELRGYQSHIFSY